MMYFIPRNNRIYSYLITISQYSWYVLTLLFLMFIGFGWWITFYAPMLHQERTARAQYNSAQQKQASFIRIQTASGTLEKELVQSTATLHSFVQSVAPYQIQVNTLITKSLDAGLLLESYTTKVIEETPWYSVRDAYMSFSGGFENIVRFFHVLQLRNYILRVCEFVIKKNDGQYLHLQCTLRIVEFNNEKS